MLEMSVELDGDMETFFVLIPTRNFSFILIGIKEFSTTEYVEIRFVCFSPLKVE